MSKILWIADIIMEKILWINLYYRLVPRSSNISFTKRL